LPVENISYCSSYEVTLPSIEKDQPKSNIIRSTFGILLTLCEISKRGALPI